MAFFLPKQFSLPKPEHDISNEKNLQPIFEQVELILSIDFLNSEIKKDDVKLYISVMEMFSSVYLNFVGKADFFPKEIKDEINEKAVEIFSKLNLISFMSIKVCHEFIEQKGLPILFKLLTDDNILQYYNTDKNSEEVDDSVKDLDFVVRRIIGSVFSLARTFSTHKIEWKNNNATQNVFKFWTKTKHLFENDLYGSMTLAYLTDDEEIQLLPQLADTIPTISSLLEKSAKLISEDENLERCSLCLDDSGTCKKVFCVSYKDSKWNVINLLKGLNQLSICDEFKNKIYFELGVGKSLNKLILHGNQVEKEYALILLWQLCFSSEVADDVRNNSSLIEFITQLSLDQSQDNAGIGENSRGLLWTLNKDRVLQSHQPYSQTSFPDNDVSSNVMNAENKDVVDKQHIMISYNSGSRDLCLKIKDELEKQNHNVWIDVYCMNGSSLESMASAIENSLCVLMCMTEKYKLSNNCRAEAEYAFSMSKPIIPLIMQKDYKPDGWLGIILGSKIYIHFIKYEFEECIRRLNHEIQSIINACSANEKEDKTKNITEKKDVSLVKITPKVTKALDWNESETESWFYDKSISFDIANSLRPCHGHVLHQLYKMYLQTPDFILDMLLVAIKSLNEPIPLRDVCNFTYELEAIFNS